MVKAVLTFIVFSSLLILALSLVDNPVQNKVPPVAYEDDLTERCRDWLYWREQILKRHHAGDAAGADEARRNMRAFMSGLEARFTDEQISSEISRLEDSAARKGVPSWSSAAGK